MSPEAGEKLIKDRKKTEDRVTDLYRQENRQSVFEEAGKGAKERLFSDLHACLFEKPEREASLYEKAGKENGGHIAVFDREDRENGLHAALPERVIRLQLADTAMEMRDFLQPEKRTGAELKTMQDKFSELERSLLAFSGKPGSLSPEFQELLKSVRHKKRQLDEIIAKNIPSNPGALRSYEEVQAGIGANDAADLIASGALEEFSGILTGQRSSVDGKRAEDLEHLVNEIDAMTDRHRYTKEQQALGIMEKQSLGTGYIRTNRVLQEARETEHESQVIRETGEHEENAGQFEFGKGEEERDALAKKHDILKNIARGNRNILRQIDDEDSLEIVRSMMYNGERKMGFAPLAAMGLGGNLNKGFNGMNFMLAMSPVAADKYKNQAEIRKITVRYLGLDELYRNFMTKNSDIQNRTAFLKRYGMEGNVRVMIRKGQDKALGIGSENRMNSVLMQKYAEELWKGAFLREDGSVITEKERQAEAPEQKKDRKLYADMLRAMGFNVRYPGVEGEMPGISAAEIFSRLVN